MLVKIIFTSVYIYVILGAVQLIPQVYYIQHCHTISITTVVFFHILIHINQFFFHSTNSEKFNLCCDIIHSEKYEKYNKVTEVLFYIDFKRERERE